MNKKHGHTTHTASSPTYKSWHMMKQRCLNPNYDQYENYGGRGIKVVAHWGDFENFLADMGKRPEGMTLDRIDNSKGYSKANCRWATKKEQQRNRRTNRMLSYQGETMCLLDWANRLGIKQHSLSMRIDVYGWTVEEALSTPKMNRGKHL